MKNRALSCFASLMIAILSAAGSLALLTPCFALGAVPEPVAAPTNAGSRIARIVKIHGVPTLEVDGAPLLLVGAQCDIWRSTRQDEKTVAFFDAYQKMNATCVSVGIPWSKTEISRDCYDFRFLDWFLEQAQKHGLKLVLNLFNSNICGKVQEGSGASAYPVYTPAYILDAPADFQRMQLPSQWQYDAGGPPMCPNDPRTLERERRLCEQVAAHLKQKDIHRTVIMLQINNEFYYQQWAGSRPEAEKQVRCHCPYCEEKGKTGGWKDGEDFMFHSFADYVRVLSDTIAGIHPLPLYVNSPWWPPYVVPIFLDRCPNLSLAGIDGVFGPNEPNMLSRSQLGRNIPFAAENPTENPQTRLNLDVLPYYSLIGQQGLGNLLWECGPPHTVLEDPQARQRYGDALYPIRWAQSPIAKARGTENLIGWHAIRDIAAGVTTDVFGNYISEKKDASFIQQIRLFIREGTTSRMGGANGFAATLGDLRIEVRHSAAGIILRHSPTEVVLAIPKGRVAMEGPRIFQASEGRFRAGLWMPERGLEFHMEDKLAVFDIREPKVILLRY